MVDYFYIISYVVRFVKGFFKFSQKNRIPVKFRPRVISRTQISLRTRANGEALAAQVGVDPSARVHYFFLLFIASLNVYDLFARHTYSPAAAVYRSRIRCFGKGIATETHFEYAQFLTPVMSPIPKSRAPFPRSAFLRFSVS